VSLDLFVLSQIVTSSCYSNLFRFQVEIVPTVEYGKVTEIGFNHENNEDYCTIVHDLLGEFPGDDEVILISEPFFSS
jgi:hypothetical protein